MRRRRYVRTLAPALLMATGSGLVACDTNDGRDMREPDPYQAYVLENTTPSTTSTTTTTTIAPPTTPEPSTSVVDTESETADETSVDSVVETAAGTVAGAAASTSASPSTTGAATPDTSVDPSLPVDTFAESLGLANLAADGVEFAGPWTSGGEIAVEYTCNGAEDVPLLTWTTPPEGTFEMALVVVDETADNFAHWIVIGLPPEAGSLGGPEPVVVGTEAMNSVGNIGWAGPCPPDSDVHTYRFTLYGLNEAIELPPESVPGDLIQAIEASATGAASITGTYQVA